MILPDLFHWSPADRRDAIRSEGLRTYCAPAVSSPGHAFPYLCFSSDPKAAWRLSGDMEWVSEVEEWDLWQVRLADTDEVRYNPSWGPVLEEIRVYNPIPADRIWLVGTRSCPCAEPTGG